MSARLQAVYFFTVFLLAIFLMYFVVESYIVPVFIALVCAVAFRNLHDNLSKKIVSKNLAAFFSVLLVLLFTVIPLTIIGSLVYSEASSFYTSLSDSSTSSALKQVNSPAGYVNLIFSTVEKHLQEYVPQLKIDFRSVIFKGLNWLISNTGAVFGAFFKIGVDLLIMIFALFYLFRDGGSLRTTFLKLSPLDDNDDTNILDRLEVTINSVVRGSLIVSFIQGAVTAVGFIIFGLPQPVLWGVVAALCSLIPGIGSGLVSIPTVFFLFYSGNIVIAIGYTIWAILITGTIDNILSPYLIDRKVKIHPFLILLSVLGGLSYFGAVGLLAGPVSLAFATELLKLYPKFIMGGKKE